VDVAAVIVSVFHEAEHAAEEELADGVESVPVCLGWYLVLVDL
jgi:hypothetical protein